MDHQPQAREPALAGRLLGAPWGVQEPRQGLGLNARDPGLDRRAGDLQDTADAARLRAVIGALDHWRRAGARCGGGWSSPRAHGAVSARSAGARALAPSCHRGASHPCSTRSVPVHGHERPGRGLAADPAPAARPPGSSGPAPEAPPRRRRGGAPASPAGARDACTAARSPAAWAWLGPAAGRGDQPAAPVGASPRHAMGADPRCPTAVGPRPPSVPPVPRPPARRERGCDGAYRKATVTAKGRREETSGGGRGPVGFMPHWCHGNVGEV
jgi:hypothetical protein